MEQLGPVQFFYTFSCGNKRWEENLTTIVAKTNPCVTVMHYIEEIASDESILDCKERKTKEKQYEEDELKEDVDIIKVTSARAKRIMEENPEYHGKPTYYVHEK